MRTASPLLLSDPNERIACTLGVAVAAALMLAVPSPARADTGKLLLTGGVTTIDGAAGGGLTPWAIIGSNATDDQYGASAAATWVHTQDYKMTVTGAAVGLRNRLELSYAHQDFDTGGTGVALGLPGLHLKQDVYGAKMRLFGEAILDSDSWLPQVAAGVELKRLDAQGLAPTLAALGAHRQGTDVYLSATKLFLAQSLLVNGTLRLTKANQNGLLGFGGTAHESASVEPEASVAWLAMRTLAFGVEYRAKPDNLNPSALGAGLQEDDWVDLFAAWAPCKLVSLTAAWVDLGPIVPAVAARRQTGAYLSAQLAF